MRKPLPEIARCECGRKAILYRASYGVCLVICPRFDAVGELCWRGPTRKTERDAINAWNRGRGEKP